MLSRSRRLLSTSSANAERPWVRRTGAVLFSGVVVFTGYLSAWQLNRHQWKISLIERRKEMLKGALEPIAAVVPPEAATSGISADLEYRRVWCVGTFDHSKQILMGPRSAPAGMEAAAAAATGKRNPPGAPTPSGWDVITPFTCTDGTVLLVDRGWVRTDQAEPGDSRAPC